MGRLCALIVATLPIAVALVPAMPVTAAQPPKPAEPPPLKIGMPENMFNGIPTGIIGVASKPFQTMFEKQTGLKADVGVEKDYAAITNKLRNGTLDIAVLHGFEYSWVKQHPELIPLLVAVPTNKLQACLVVHVESNAKEPKDLKGDCIVVPGTTKAHCLLYLERLKTKLPEGACGTTKPDKKSIEDVLNAVAAKDNEAALVDINALNAFKNNTPGVGAQLKVLSQSDTFPGAIIVYRKDAFDAKTATKVCEGLTKAVATAEGRNLINLWKLKGFAEPTQQYQKELDECLKAFHAPKK